MSFMCFSCNINVVLFAIDPKHIVCIWNRFKKSSADIKLSITIWEEVIISVEAHSVLHVMTRTGPWINPWRTMFGCSCELSCWLNNSLKFSRSGFTMKIIMASVCVWSWKVAAVEVCYFRKTSPRWTRRAHHGLHFHLLCPLSETSLASSHYGLSELRANNKDGEPDLWVCWSC